MRRCELLGPRIDEAAARGLSVESRDQVDERLVGGEVVPQILQPWRSAGRDSAAVRTAIITSRSASVCTRATSRPGKA